MVAIRELDRLEEVEMDWRELAESRSNAFLTPEWADCWFKHYGAGFEPLVVAVRADGGRVRGLLPMALSASGRPRIATLVGANLGDRFHPVCKPGEEPEVAAAAGEALAACGDPWSTVILDHVDTAGGWVDALGAGTDVRLARLERVAAGLPFIDLSRYSDWDGYLADRSSNFRQQVRRFRRNAARDHELRFRRTESSAGLDSDLSTFFELHDRRWQGRGGSSLATDRARAFHADFAAAALARGWLRLWFMEVDGTPAAAWYGWRVGGTYAYYNAGFDPSHSNLRPGMVLMAAVIHAALEEGAAEFDFLLGNEAYKHRFADGNREVSDITLVKRAHPAAAVARAEQAARRVARLIPADTRARLGLGRLARRSAFGGRRR